jgi:hypothetical protein
VGEALRNLVILLVIVAIEALIMVWGFRRTKSGRR